MAITPENDRPEIIGSAKDPTCAEPLEIGEQARLLQQMRTVLLPRLSHARDVLITAGFTLATAGCRGGLASLEVEHRPRFRGWLRFHLHRTFGPLLSTEPFFWMYATYWDDQVCVGQPGRLFDLNDTAKVNSIVSEFTFECIKDVQFP